MTGTHPRAGAGKARKSAIELVETFLDPGSRRGWDQPVEITTTDPDYRADLERARERTGLDESVITGEGRIEGRRVAYVACEFRFLAGSIGVAAGERLVRAVERATAERLPLLAAPASGGTRMQEGTVAFLQMVKVAAAITDHKAAGLPYLVHVRHPTTGGVLASWGSLGHVTAAEPGALIGFMGPRVHEALYGEEFPAGVQVAENLMNHGLIDAVLPTSRLAEVAARVLRVLCGDDALPPRPAGSGPGVEGGSSGCGPTGDASDVPAAGQGGVTGAAAGRGGVPSASAAGLGAAAEPCLGAGEVVPGAERPATPSESGPASGMPDAPAARAAGGGAGSGASGGLAATGAADAGPGSPSTGSEAERGAVDAAAAGAAGPSAVRGGAPSASVSGAAAGGEGAGGGAPGGSAAAGPRPGGGGVAGAGATAVGPSAEESIRASRRGDRPGVRDLLRVAAEDVSPLSGTGAGEHDPGLLLALARVGGVPCVVLGHNRGGRRGSARASAEGQPLGPAGLRTARRGMHIAAELGLPLLTVIDTAGAALSREAEEGGLAGEIARCLADMVTLPAPTLCLLLGQGAGGVALALLPADRVVAARHAWLSPLPPEGASAILHRTTDRAYEVADRQGVRSADLLASGIVDRVVEEDGEESDGFLARLGHILGAELAALRAQDPAERMAARRARHRRIGLPS
ncbi:carboxyl transferase domain-containing protein [Streptomyces sp. NPDC059850]|uniref:carboxyl transferase domain-containing protein n=1 Tax=Streptomyces sp. NPDC059850 TaxID=3346970 RepID=UPI00366140D9